MTSKKIIDLRWDETSGVDHSANNEEGWAVMKNADVAGVEDLDKLIEQEATLAKAADDLLAQLKALKGTDVPKEVSSACDVISKYLESQYGYGTPDGGKPDEVPVPKSFAALVRSLWEKVTSARKTNIGTPWSSPPRGGAGGASGSYPAPPPHIKKAFEVEWPALCKTVASIYKSDATTEDKSSQLAKAVDDLRSKVESANSES